MIAAEQRAEIRRLFYAEHWKVGTIAATLSVHRDTVLHAIEAERFHAGRGAQARATQLDPYLPFVRETLEQYPKLRAPRLHEMLRSRGYAGSVVQLRRLVRPLRPRPLSEAFLRLRTLPGEQAQADWGCFGAWGERRLSCFVMVLSWSRALHALFTLDQSMESFLRGHRDAFEFFGGVPRQVLYDNLKSAVLERRGEAIRFHPRLLDLCGHYHFAPRPVAPARGNEKGRVERQIQYLRSSFFAARRFRDVDDLNAQFRQWRDEIAHQRRQPVEAEGRVADAFARERAFLLPLPAHPFEAQSVLVLRSGKTPYLRFDRNCYSIPSRLVRQPLTLVADVDTLRILDGQQEVARHPRAWAVRQVVEHPEHLAELVDTKRRARELKARDRLRAAVPDSERLFLELARRGDPLGRHVARLFALLDTYGADELRAAVAIAIEREAWGAGSGWRTSWNSAGAPHASRPASRSICPRIPACVIYVSRRTTSETMMPSSTTTTTTPTPPTDLRQALTTLGLHRLAESFDDFVARATRARSSVVQVVEEIVRTELEERARRSVARHLGRAHLGRFKPMADFDWNWPRTIDRAGIERVLTLDFIERGENVVLVASHGLGKTMIAKNIAHAAALAGHSALCVSASDLLLDLAKQDTARTLERRLRHYMHFRVLVVDEIGYLAYDNTAADLLFQIVTRRYERRPLVLTTNLAFSDWNTVFPNAACATALIDRLTHHAEILTIEGESYRRREAEEQKKKRRSAK